ncbi:hypothetical protein PVNG_02407 [Plasmodium vivax North Korean]|uniref:inorganic diphosphatase n=1 Tax=Plasmodium vivax North Korean TaxID=1035514 RepID=A0A0J9TLS3_PLAVI|nr:hypothetical protein PVNG_02407 [Plasmodium vivax North Korean]
MTTNSSIFECYIEISKGSNLKYELTSSGLKLDRVLYGSYVYPQNYGFIKNTLGEDGDPLDIVLISNSAIQPGCLADARIIGSLEMIDSGEEDLKEKIDEFFSSIYNEFNQSLKSAIIEFTSLHVSHCNFQKYTSDPSTLSIYYLFQYNSPENLARLDRVFFTSPEARYILTHNYLLEIEEYSNLQTKKYYDKLFSWRKENKYLFPYEKNFKGLTFFADFNRLETHSARKILLDYS